MKVHPSECSVVVHLSAMELRAVPLWELGNKTLIWAKRGIRGNKDPVDQATGRVDELRPPPEVECVQINTQQPRNLLVRVPPECALEIRQVVMVDHLELA